MLTQYPYNVYTVYVCFCIYTQAYVRGRHQQKRDIKRRSRLAN